MISRFYKNVIFKYPNKVLSILFIGLLFFGYYATKLEIDASAETLLLENDKDLAFAREISKRYSTPDILVVTLSPKNELLSNKTLNLIKKLSDEFETLPRIESVISILNIPLFESPKQELKDLVDNVITLQSNDVKIDMVKEELLSSPLYKQRLVSKDFKTTALILKLKRDNEYYDLLERRNELALKDKSNMLSTFEEIEFKKIKSEFKSHRDVHRAFEHDDIIKIRNIISKNNQEAQIFLGGVTMIADDIITFVKNDLMIYGVSLIVLIIFILWIIFRQLRWIILSIVICLLSVVTTSGVLGLFSWEITVISSNFMAMQLIITLSIIIHLIVRYKELNERFIHATQTQLVLNTVLSKINPSFFAIITTIAGFASLIFSNIQPVINLGWMMSVGILLSLIIAFLIFPSILIQLNKKNVAVKTTANKKFNVTIYCSNIVEYHPKAIFFATILLIILSIIGSSKLIVENSFINYFKKDTHIYEGMVVIDKQLGGTTPLDVVVTFNQEDKLISNDETIEEDSFDEEFKEDENSEQYWFTDSKMQKILKVHDYLENIPEIGNVQSFATMLKVGKTINNNKDLDAFKLALLYNELPQKYKELVLSPYLDIEKNQVRFETRVIDSNEDLRRNELIQKIQNDLNKLLPQEDVKISNLMVLYNNMLQSLFNSQIKTLGFVILILFGMFLILFKSFKLAFIAIISNIIPIGIVFAVMGFGNIPLNIMTITIAAISIGIGVDDTIHYIHRFHYEFKKDHDYILSMKRTHNSIGHAMVYTSFVVMIGFSILILSNLIPTIYFGLLTVLVMLTILAAALLLLPLLLIKLEPYS